MRAIRDWSSKATYVSVCLLLSALFFFIDLSIPLGVAAAVPYVAVVLLALRIKDARYTYGFAISSSLLTLLGFFLSSELGAMWQVIFNRSLALFAIWACAVLSLQLQHSMKATGQLKKRLANATRLGEMDELVTGVAHEINQPLAAIVTYCDAGRRYLASDPVAVDQLEVCMNNAAEQAHRASEVIKNLRLLVQKENFSNESVDCAILVDEVLRLLEDDLDQHAATIRVDLADKLPPIIANQSQIEQVIVKLVENSFEALGELQMGREILIRVSCDGGALVTFTIEDPGQGVAPEVVGELFEPFVTTHADSVGLGLSVSRSIVAAHGGKLQYRPRQPRGSIFAFSIPAGGPSQQQ